MPPEAPIREKVRTAEVIAALSLATDLGTELPLEHGLHSTLFAIRLCERLGVDTETAFQAYYGCLLFHVGCTTDADIAAELFDEGMLREHWAPVMFGSQAQTMLGIMRALASRDARPPMRAVKAVSRLPKAVRSYHRHLNAMCEVAQMLTGRLGLPASVRELFGHLTERWDGKGDPAGLRGDQIPLAVRIMHVARDAAFQRMFGGEQYAARVVQERAGHAFDPAIATRLADEATEIMGLPADESVWALTLAGEPGAQLALEGDDIDRAVAAMGNFADLLSPYFVGHSAGVAELSIAAGKLCRFSDVDLVGLRRSALVHDLGRVAIPAAIWLKPAALTADEWERVRLHAYHSERVLCRSAFLASLAPTATAHHERLDGSGYHRGAVAAGLTPAARLLAAADAYHAMTEPRPYREPLSPQESAETLRQDARAGRLDADSVAAVLEAAGHQSRRVERPAGLTDREAQVVCMLARGLQTKQVARRLGISVKTADRHVQNAYAKIGISTRAAAALFAMQYGLVTWGELPMYEPGEDSYRP